MLEAEGRYWRTDGKAYVYLPAAIANDSACPLKGKKGKVKVRIDGDRLVIEKV